MSFRTRSVGKVTHGMPQALKLFLSSPGDVPEERVVAQRVLRRVAQQYRELLELTMVVWEHEPLSAHTGFQQQIERPSECDLLVSILWSRLGTRLPADYVLTAGEEPPTGTEFEIRDALDARQRVGRPDVWIYRRTTPPRIDASRSDAREQLAQYEALDAFCARRLRDDQGGLLAHHHYDAPHEFERAFTAHLRAWLDRRLGDSRTPVKWRDGTPYLGLRAFEARHQDIYFGRTQAVSHVLHCIRSVEADAHAAERMLLVQGMSGIGKTSLLCAGVLPLLEGRAIQDIDAWLQLVVRPSESAAELPVLGPFAALAERLLQTLPEARSILTIQALSEGLFGDPASAVAMLHGYLSQQAAVLGVQPAALRLVVYVDQLEECWALSAAVRDSFARCLLALAQDGRIWVCATVRSDFMPRMEEARDFGALLGAAQTYTLLPPRPDELVEMIREPAAAAGLHWEHVDGTTLDQVVLREAIASPEGLPLLEFALEQLYQNRRGALLTFDAHRAFGGLAGSIADAAEKSIAGNAAVGDAALRTVLRLLVSVEPGGIATRRRATHNEFAGQPAVQRILAALEARRLCTVDGAEIAFAHDALITNWPRLLEWLKRETPLLQAREMLHADAEEWRRSGQPRSLLVTAPEKVAKAQSLLAAGLDLGVDRDFIAASLRRASQLRIARVATVGVIATLAVGAWLAAWAGLQQRDAKALAVARALAKEGAAALAAGDSEGARKYIAEAERAWIDNDGRVDKYVAFEKLRVDLVRRVATDEANQHAPMLNWSFPSGSRRQSALLFLNTSLGDVIVVDPVGGSTTMLKNYGSSVAAVGGSMAHEFIVIDDEVRLTRYDGRNGERKGVLSGGLPSGSVAVACDSDGCYALGWNESLQRCELVRVAAASTSWEVRRWALQPLAGARLGMDTKSGCAWKNVQRQHPQGLVAIDQARRAWAIDTSTLGGAAVRALGTDVTQVVVLDSHWVALLRPTGLERVDAMSGAVASLSANAANVETLTVSVRGGLIASVLRDGTVELLRDGQAYSLGRTGELPLRVFELAGTRAVLAVNKSGLVRMVDYRSGRELYRWRVAPSPLRGAFFSDASHRLSVLTSAGELHVWDVSGLEATAAMAAAPLTQAAKSAAVRRSSAVSHQRVKLQLTETTVSWATDVDVRHVFTDPDADMALLVTSHNGLLWHRGHLFEAPGVRPSMGLAAGGGAWLVSDGGSVWRIATSADSTPEVALVWQAAEDERVSRLVALEGGGVALVLRNSLVVLDEGGVERTRTRIDASFEADLIRAHVNGDVLVLENAACDQRRVHLPTGQRLHEVVRLCEEAR